jgi:lipopolysaccharide export LptBFGC system permease protein LptF
MMTTKYILSILAVFFLLLGGARLLRDGALRPAAKSWLLVGGIFAAVSAWLFWHSSVN